MKIQLAYGGVPLVVDLPSHVHVTNFSPHKVEHPVSFDEFHAAFAAAWKRDSSEAPTPLIVVNDAYRHTRPPSC